MGTAENCIGIRIKQLGNRIELDQPAYIHQILDRFNMNDCKPTSTPSDINQKLSNSMISTTKIMKKLKKFHIKRSLEVCYIWFRVRDLILRSP